MILTQRIDCPCCKKNKFKELFSMSYGHEKMISFLENYYGENIKKYLNDLKNYKYNLIECVNCLTIFQDFIPTDEFSFQLYEEIISSKKSFEKKLNFDSKNFSFYFDEIIALQNLINKKSFSIKVLEFGAGWGTWSIFAKSLNFDIYVNEFSINRKKFLEKNNLKIIEDLNSSEETFDLIYSNQTFEHLNYPRETFNLLYKKLNKNGLIYLKFPDSFFFKNKIKKNYIPCKDAAHPLEHINLFNINSFLSIVSDLNMKVLNLDKHYKFSFKKHLKLIRNLFRFDNILLKKNN
tara:strand:- start:933 stop:1808 length:876 start_codon:yes stop_codon:yes gene_type:complete